MKKTIKTSGAMSWKKVKLGEVLKQYRIEHLVQNNIEYKQVTISKHDGVCFRGYKKGNDIGRKRQFIVDLKKYPNTLMFVRQGVEDGSIGIAPKEVDGCIATENMPMFSVEGIETEFLKAIIKSKLFRDEVAKIPTTGSAQKSIHERQLLEIEIPLPEKKEQKIIIKEVEQLEALNSELTTELSHQQDLLQQLRQAFLREAMQGNLTPALSKGEGEDARLLLEKIKAEKAKSNKKEKPLPPIKEDEIPFAIPENWVWCRLGEIAENIEYGTSEKADLNSDNIPVLRMNNIQDGKLDLENLKYVKSSIDDLPKLYLKNKDLLFNRTNSWELVGKSGVYHGEDDIMTFASYLIRVQFEKNISVDFINAYINSSLCRTTQLEPDIIQQNGQANFNGTKLRNIICPLPPLAEQKRIVKKLEELMQLCDELKNSISTNQTHTQQLLQVALKEALEMKEI